MRKSSKITLQALVAGVILFVAALPFGKHGWQESVGSVLFVLAVLAAGVFVGSGVYSLATKSRAGVNAK